MINPELKSVVATRPIYKLSAYVYKSGNDNWKSDNPYEGEDFDLYEQDFYGGDNTISVEYGGSIIGNAISKTAHLRLVQSENYSVDDFVDACLLLEVLLYRSNGNVGVTVSREYYFVTSAKENGSSIEIVASDIMKKADVPYVSELSGNSWTLLDFLRDAVRQAGMAVSPSLTNPFKNYDFVVTQKPVGYTCRQIIGYIAMLACGNALSTSKKSPTASIEISSLSTDEPYNELSQWISNEPAADVIQITGLKTTQYYDSSGAELVTPIVHKSTSYDPSYVYEFDNPLATGREAAAITAMSDIMDLQFVNFRGTHIGYPLAEFGDYAEITHAGGTFSTFLTSINWDISGATEFACNIASRADNASVYEEAYRPTGGGGGGGSWDDITDKPFDTLGDSLKVNNRALEVNSTDDVEQDNTLPITSSAVYTTIGNIKALLETI